MISVIIPIYGVESYIERCARSVLGQTFDDIEYIFVNDNTQDNSMLVLNKVVKEYSHRNIHIINKSKNEGLPQARRTGFLASHGDYIIHFDSDDWVEPDCINDMYKTAMENDADIVIADYFENYRNKQKRIKCKQEFQSSTIVDMMLRAKFHSGVWNKLVRRSVYNTVKFPIENMHEDLVIMVQIFSNAYRIGYVDSAFYHYNLSNSSSLTSDRKSFKRANGVYTNLRIIERFFIENNMLGTKIAPFSNFVNTFKGDMLLNKQTRNIDWLYSLCKDSYYYIFSECRLAFWKKTILWAAFNRVFFPLKWIDLIKRIYVG